MSAATATGAACGTSSCGRRAVDLERVLAHQAISSIFEPSDGPREQAASTRSTSRRSIKRCGRAARGHIAVGRLRVRSRRTWNQAECRFVVIHFGSLDFHAVLSQEPEADPAQFDAFKKQLLATHRSGSLADLTSLVAREFPGRAHRLDDLFRDEQRRIIGIILQDRFADYQRSFERLAVQDAEMLARLGQLSYPIPKPLRAAASTYLDIHLRDEIGRLARGEAVNLEALEELCDRGRRMALPAGARPAREGPGGVALGRAARRSSRTPI